MIGLISRKYKSYVSRKSESIIQIQKHNNKIKNLTFLTIIHVMLLHQLFQMKILILTQIKYEK